MTGDQLYICVENCNSNSWDFFYATLDIFIPSAPSSFNHESSFVVFKTVLTVLYAQQKSSTKIGSVSMP